MPYGAPASIYSVGAGHALPHTGVVAHGAAPYGSSVGNPLPAYGSPVDYSFGAQSLGVAAYNPVAPIGGIAGASAAAGIGAAGAYGSESGFDLSAFGPAAV